MAVKLSGSVVVGLMVILSITISMSQAENVTITQKAVINVTIDDYPAGQFVMGLFGKTCPKTVANFVAYCKGTPGISYEGSIFHRVINGFVVQGGDIVNRDGTGFTSIYGGVEFPDENLNGTHYVGSVNMANKGPNTNGVQFAILTTKADWLNGKHVVFAMILEGMDTVHKLESLPRNANDHPIPTPLISKCSIVDVPVPYVVQQN